jgi:hypothetical protein
LSCLVFGDWHGTYGLDLLGAPVCCCLLLSVAVAVAVVAVVVAVVAVGCCLGRRSIDEPLRTVLYYAIL